MNTITIKDGTQIYFKDWGKGQPVVFCHGWPLSSDSWESQMFFLASNGYRTLVIHGDDDQVVPIDASGRASAKLVKGAKLIVYPRAPHGLTDTHKDKLNADLLGFIKA